MRRLAPAWLSAAAASFFGVSVGCGRAAPPPGEVGATGRRPVIDRAADQAPAVDGTVEVVRKTPRGYLVTPKALIPFAAMVRGGHGLDHLAYVVTAARTRATGQVGPEGPEQNVPVESFTRLLRHRDGKGLPLREFRI